MPDKHTVFKAELVGMLLGLQLIKDNSAHNLTCVISVDNQAVIKALASRLNKPGHYLAAEVINEAQQLKNTKGRKFALTIRWTAGHSNIPGNEEVDKEAKKAVEGHMLARASLPKILRKPMKTSKSATRQKQQESVKARWIKEWKRSPRYDKLKHIDPSLPSRKFVKLISNKKIHRAAASKIFQLRLGHIPLNVTTQRVVSLDLSSFEVFCCLT
jgi:ribonuclease HI